MPDFGVDQLLIRVLRPASAALKDEETWAGKGFERSDDSECDCLRSASVSSKPLPWRAATVSIVAAHCCKISELSVRCNKALRLADAANDSNKVVSSCPKKQLMSRTFASLKKHTQFIVRVDFS